MGLWLVTEDDGLVNLEVAEQLRWDDGAQQAESILHAVFGGPRVVRIAYIVVEADRQKAFTALVNLINSGVGGVFRLTEPTCTWERLDLPMPEDA